MSIFTNAVAEMLDQSEIETFFVDRYCCKWWNAHRRHHADAIALLGGWYWSYQGEEAGPFRTRSGALRDAYYRRLLKLRPPLMDQSELADAKAELIPKPAKRRARRLIDARVA